MKKRLALITTIYALIATIFATAPDGHAAITWGPITDTPTTLSGSADWDGTGAPDTATIVSPGGYWWVSLTFNETIRSYSVTYELQHLTAPHPTDTLPADKLELGNIIPKVTGSGMATGMTEHNIGAANHNGHTDTGMIDETALINGVHVDFKGHHTPEAYVPEIPETGMIFGGAAIGFLAFRLITRRLCRHTD
jgi:hypothetical protein